MIERGSDTTITLFLLDDDGETGLTPDAGAVVDIYAGSTLQFENVTVTEGDPSTAFIDGNDTADLELSDLWQERWVVDIAGERKRVTQTAYLVRTAIYPVVSVEALTDRHSDLDDLGSLEGHLRAAWQDLNRDLIRRGNRPQLVMDSWALFDLHLARALTHAFRDAHQAIGDGRYLDLANTYDADYRRLWSETEFRYDFDESGTLSESERKPAQPALIWTGRPPRDRWLQ